MGDWGTGLNAAGSCYWIDNFRIIVPSSHTTCALDWSAEDAGGIEDYSFVIDNSSDTIPDEVGA